MKMPNRYGAEKQYRYGFNGMESDDEMYAQEGNSYDFGARMYDARTGRWNKLDNHSKPFQSNYAFAKGNPIVYIDPDGNDDFYYNKHGFIVHRVETGSAPRFFKFEMHVSPVQVTEEHMIGIYRMKRYQVRPTARQIAAATYHSWDMTIAVADDYKKHGMMSSRMGVLDAQSGMRVSQAHYEFLRGGGGILLGIGALPLAEFFMLYMIEGIIAGGLEAIVVEEVVDYTLEETVGFSPVGLGDVIEGGVKKVAKEVVEEGNEKIIKGYTRHGLDQKISRKVKSKDINDAVKNPLKTGDVKVDKNGRKSQRYTGEKAEVAVNPESGKVVSTNPTSTKKANRLKKQNGTSKTK